MPIVGKHNAASIKILEKCGFIVRDEDQEFERRGDEMIPGVLIRLK